MGQISTVNHHATTEAPWIKWSLIGIALSFLALFLVLPLAVVLYGAFKAGLKVWWQAVTDPDALASIRLTMLVLIIVVPTNAIFGVAIAWAIAKFEFRGKTILISIIDMPFAISPVVVGLIFVILFGAQGWFGPWLAAHDLKVIFAVPGIVIVIMFGTLPFIARELIPLMQQQGKDEEEKGFDDTGKCIVAVDPRYFRPTEVETLLGDASKAKTKLGWTPKITFAELVSEMVREDLKTAERDELTRKHGYTTFSGNE